MTFYHVIWLNQLKAADKQLQINELQTNECKLHINFQYAKEIIAQIIEYSWFIFKGVIRISYLLVIEFYLE